MKIHIKTYGCQMNERDSEALAGMLTEAGHVMVDSEEAADVLLFNTCSVREQAERKAKGKIGYMRKLKARKPELVIGALGCMAQRLGNELLNELPHLDFVLGTGQLHTLVPLIESIRADRRQVASITESADVLTGMGSHYRPEGDGMNFKAQIAITRGCNRFCSYCIVPYVRGREISREPADVVAEARELVAGGAKEIMLLGQNVAAYGWGGNVNPPPAGVSPFAELLEELDRIPGLLRIRFTSPYPTYFNDRLIAAIAQSRTVCHNIHLPLQSGSDRILAAMNRQYTADGYRAVAAALRTAMPDVTFSTDVIVGFPGESDEDFRLTRELINEIGFDNSFIFKYSPRPGGEVGGAGGFGSAGGEGGAQCAAARRFEDAGRSGVAAAGRFGAGGAGGRDEPAQSGALERTHRDEPGDPLSARAGFGGGDAAKGENHARRKRFALRRAGAGVRAYP